MFHFRVESEEYQKKLSQYNEMFYCVVTVPTVAWNLEPASNIFSATSFLYISQI